MSENLEKIVETAVKVPIKILERVCGGLVKIIEKTLEGK